MANFQDWLNVNDGDILAEVEKHYDVNRPLYLAVGLFLRKFGVVENQIDRNTMHIIGMTQNFEQFGYFSQTLAVSGKCKAFRSAMQNNATDPKKIGKNLADRLKFFERDINALRIRICHYLLEADTERVFFCHTGAALDNPPIAQRPSQRRPESISYPNLARLTLWLRDFSADLNALADVTWTAPIQKTYEIDDPQSSPPAHTVRWKTDR